MAKSCLRRVWEDAGPDKGYSFVVFAALWLFCFFMYMPVRSSGVLFHSIMMSMNVTPGQATWPFSLIITVSSFASIVSGYLQLSFSARQILLVVGTLNILSCGLIFILPLDILWITLSMGVIYGFGHGLSTIAVHVIASEYFNQYRTLAVGLAFTGVSVFGLVGPPFILTPITDEYDIRGVFLFLGALSSHVFISAVLVRPRNSEQFLSLRENNVISETTSEIMAENQSIAQTDDQVDFETYNKPTKFSNCLRVVFPTEMRFLMRNKLFGLLSFASSMGEISFYSFLAISVSTSVAKGVPENDARLAITAYSAGEIISRLLIGSLVDKRIVSAENMFTTIFIGISASLTIFGWASRLWIILTSAFTFGLSYGGFQPVRTVIIGQRLGLKYISFALGYIRIISGFLYLLLPTITDALTDHEKRFDNLCYLFGGICLLAAFVWTLQKCLKTNSESE